MITDAVRPYDGCYCCSCSRTIAIPRIAFGIPACGDDADEDGRMLLCLACLERAVDEEADAPPRTAA